MPKYDSSAIKTDGRLKIDMAQDIAYLAPSETPFTALIKNIKKEKCMSPKFEWLERDQEARWDAINLIAGYVAGATSIVVDNGAYFRAGMLVKVPRTGEVLLVTAIATNTLTIVRGFGETSAAALVDNDPLLIIGNTNEEFASAPGDAGGSPTSVFNYTQIFRTPFAVSNTANASATYGGKLITQEQKVHGVDHMRDMERALLFGERKEDLTGSAPKRATRGLLKFLNENVKSSAGQLSELAFNTWLQDVFAYGESTKTLFASPLLVSVISTWATGKLQTVPEAKAKYGIEVVKYISAHGQLNIIKQPNFEGAIYGGYGAIVDLSKITYKNLEGRDTSLKTNIQSNDADGRRDEYLSEVGLKVENPKAHGVIIGVTGAA